MIGIQCPKALYLDIHEPELRPETSEAQQAIFDQGHEVGREAQKYFPGGYLVKTPHYQAEEAQRETWDAIEAGHNTIFEATFAYEDVQAKIDILHRENKQAAWQIIEVKSSTKVKDEHLQDVAIQAWVAEGAGLNVGSKHLMHLNRECVFPELYSLRPGWMILVKNLGLQFPRKSRGKLHPYFLA